MDDIYVHATHYDVLTVDRFHSVHGSPEYSGIPSNGFAYNHISLQVATILVIALRYG